VTSPLQNTISRFAKKHLGGALKREMLKGVVGSVFVKLLTITATLLASVLLARILGAKGYGEYSFAMTLAAPLVMFSQLGMPMLIVRETAKNHQSQNWGEMLGLWQWTSNIALKLAVPLCTAAFGLAYLLSESNNGPIGTALMWALLAVPAVILLNLKAAALKGLRRVVLSLFIDTFLPKIILILFLLIALTPAGAATLTADSAARLYFISMVIALLLGWALFKKSEPFSRAARPKPVFQSGVWVAAAMPLAFLVAVRAANQHVAVLSMGAFSDAESIGIYRAAAQLATNVSMGIGIVNMVALPYFARFHAAGDIVRLQKLAKYCARTSLAIAVPLALFLFLFGEPVLKKLFGQEFGAGYVVLTILILAQVANAGFGPVAALLNMTGHARETVKGVATATTLNIVMCLILVPFLGMLGAAIGVGLALVLWNFLLWRSVRDKLSVNCAAL